MRERKTSDLGESYRRAGPYLGIGMQFVVSILLGLYCGHWLDSRLAWSPLFLLLGGFFGAGAGFYNLYLTVMRLQRETENPGDPESEHDA